VASESIAVLGRAGACDFVLDDPSVSREHAKIRVAGSALQVSDLGSRNGTFVNDVRIETCCVSPGQIVRFGTVAFAVMVEGTEGQYAEAEFASILRTIIRGTDPDDAYADHFARTHGISSERATAIEKQVHDEWMAELKQEKEES
jgi:pSer/pThr/pTyr-binding forkhead associated (FHA) protein